MSIKKIGLALFLADFVGLSAYAIYHYGYVGVFQQAMANAATVQITVDLVIALTIVTAWMWRDAREHGISPLPYALLILTTGSIGALIYLLRRPERAASAARLDAPVHPSPSFAVRGAAAR